MGAGGNALLFVTSRAAAARIEVPPGTQVAAIAPTTSSTLEARGIRVAISAHGGVRELAQTVVDTASRARRHGHLLSDQRCRLAPARASGRGRDTGQAIARAHSSGLFDGGARQSLAGTGRVARTAGRARRWVMRSGVLRPSKTSRARAASSWHPGRWCWSADPRCAAGARSRHRNGGAPFVTMPTRRWSGRCGSWSAIPRPRAVASPYLIEPGFLIILRISARCISSAAIWSRAYSSSRMLLPATSSSNA